MSKTREPRVKVRRDPVTGKLESEVQDSVQLAFARVVAAVDRETAALGTAEQSRLVERLIERLGKMVPRTEGE